MQPPLKRLSTGTGQQEGQRMQDVDENFGRLEQAIDTLHKKITDLIPFPASSSWYRVLEVSGRSFYLELLLYRVYHSTAPEIHRLGIGATYTGGGITKIDSHGTKIITNARLLYDTNANRCYVDLKYNNTSYGNAARLFYDYYSFEDPSPSSLILPGAANAVAESTSGYTVFSQITL